MLRRLHHEQPESFAFTPMNQEWAQGQISKYPEGRQASAVIPLLWRAQEQESWISKPALETVADMLGMDYIRVLEVATFYFMFQLKPVGTVAHVQVCGTTSCMICGAEDLIGVCKDKIAKNAHDISPDGKFSWEEVECLGACTNAPMVQIGKDFYEDLTTDKFREILEAFDRGEVPTPGPQNGRFSAEPLGGATSLQDYEANRAEHNGSVARAVDLQDTVKRIQGDEVPILTPWLNSGKSGKTAKAPPKPATKGKTAAQQSAAKKAAVAKAPATKAAAPKAKAAEKAAAKTETKAKSSTTTKASVAPSTPKAKKPRVLSAARKGGADDLKLIKGVGPKLEGVLNGLGFYHFDQISKWTDEQIEWVDDQLKFKGRIQRDSWVDQATTLAAGGETEFSKNASKKS